MDPVVQQFLCSMEDGLGLAAVSSTLQLKWDKTGSDLYPSIEKYETASQMHKSPDIGEGQTLETEGLEGEKIN